MGTNWWEKMKIKRRFLQSHTRTSLRKEDNEIGNLNHRLISSRKVEYDRTKNCKLNLWYETSNALFVGIPMGGLKADLIMWEGCSTWFMARVWFVERGWGKRKLSQGKTWFPSGRRKLSIAVVFVMRWWACNIWGFWGECGFWGCVLARMFICRSK